MTPLEALEAKWRTRPHTQTIGGAKVLTLEEAVDALVAAGHLPAPDVTIQVTLTPEEADALVAQWNHGRNGLTTYGAAGMRVRDAILEARGA